MSCAVNLLPEACHDARRRIRHRSVWVIVLSGAAVLLAGTWLVLGATGRAIVRQGQELGAVQIVQSELDRQLTLATITRNELVEQGRALLALRQDQELPEQLLALSNQAPEGVVFTEINTGSRAGKRPPIGRAIRNEASAAETGAGTAVSMRGYAVDHDQLTRLIAVLRRIPSWSKVELIRATREPYRGGNALAFHLECRQMEDTP